MIELPPTRLSTMTCLPRRSPNPCATTRPTMSLLPPAGNGTTRRTGRAGYGCADVFCTPAASNADNPPAASMMRCMVLLSCSRLRPGSGPRCVLFFGVALACEHIEDTAHREAVAENAASGDYGAHD